MRKVVFIQVPDDVDGDEVDAFLEALMPLGEQLGFSFVIVPIGWKAMEPEEIREMLKYLVGVV